MLNCRFIFFCHDGTCSKKLKSDPSDFSANDQQLKLSGLSTCRRRPRSGRTMNHNRYCLSCTICQVAASGQLDEPLPDELLEERPSEHEYSDPAAGTVHAAAAGSDDLSGPVIRLMKHRSIFLTAAQTTDIQFSISQHGLRIKLRSRPCGRYRSHGRRVHRC